MATAPSVKRLASANRTMPGRTEAPCLENLKMCISETVAMRHPNPMKHIACMLVDPNFQETLDPTAEYVQRHDLAVRLTNALGQAGFLDGQPEPPDLLKRLHEQLLAGADAPPRVLGYPPDCSAARLMGAGASADQSRAAAADELAGHNESEPVSVAELTELLGSQWSEERIKKLIAVFDDDGDGRLNDSEWTRACVLLGELPERVGGLLKEKTRAAAEKAEAAEKAKAEKEVAAAETVAAATAEAETSKAPPIEFPPGTPTDTQEAIRDEVDRVRQLPPAELAKLGTKYTDPEALWEALGALDGKATLILRGSWVKKQRGGRLPKRGDELPGEALITVQELREIHAKALALPIHDLIKRGPTRPMYGALPAIALSHYWRTKEHPDPDGVTLGLVIDALDAHWADFERKGVTDVGILIDWCGLYQAPRTEEQTPIFAEALKAINQWYAHQGTTVWCVTAGEGADGLGYHDKGWPSFEYRLAMMIKVSNDSAFNDWPQVLDLGKQGDAQWKKLARPAPAEPLAFFEGHQYGEKRYTNGADRDKIVAPKFRETTFELLGGVTELNFNLLNWGDDGAVQLAVVLPLCAKLTELELVCTQVGDKGAAALAGAIKGNGVVKTLYLEKNHIGDAGAAAFADALRINGVLEKLFLESNKIGDAGAAALADALRVNGALTELALRANQIGEDAKSKLREAVQGRSGFQLYL